MNEILVYLFFSHIIGDFYLQTETIAKRKNQEVTLLIAHGLLYCIPFLFLFIISTDRNHLLQAIVFVCLGHFLVDYLKAMLYQKESLGRKLKKYNLNEAIVYILDQGLHIIVMIGITMYFWRKGMSLSLIHADRIAEYMGFHLEHIVKWAFLISLLYKPANLTFVKLFACYKPFHPDHGEQESEMIDENNRKAGAVIGFLEKLLIVIFLSIQQYASIALIMTAKSIARYDKLSKESGFAEYYLIGTLFSLLIAIVAYYFVFSVL